MGNKQAPANPASHVEILREATRDANAAVKDLRQARKEIEDASRAAQEALAGMMQESLNKMKAHWETLIQEEITRQVKDIVPSVQGAMTRAEQRIKDRFDEIGKQLESQSGLSRLSKTLDAVTSLVDGMTGPNRERMAAVGIDEGVAKTMLGEEAV